MNHLTKSQDTMHKRKSISCPILEEFRENLKDVLSDEHTDEILAKWLRAKNFVIPKAEFLFRQHLAFRHVFECDKIREDYELPKVYDKYSFTGFLGLAKDGTALRYSPVGKGDIFGHMMSLSTFDIGRYYIWVIECDLAAMKENNERKGLANKEITYIFDMEDYSIKGSMHKIVIEIAWELGLLVQHLYPEIWKRVFFVNASPFIQHLYTIFKPIIKPPLKEKVSIVSKEDTPQELLKYVDEDVLPAFLGGKRVDSNGDPKCSEFITFGGKVPKEYYLLNQKLLMPDEPGVECLEIQSRSVHNYSIIVREAGSRVQFEIRAIDGAISIALLYKKLNLYSKNYGIPKSDEILEEKNPKSGIYSICPSVKTAVDFAPTTLKFYCPWPGIYILKLGNTFSWFQSKKIIFRQKLHPPKDNCKINVIFPYND